MYIIVHTIEQTLIHVLEKITDIRTIILNILSFYFKQNKFNNVIIKIPFLHNILISVELFVSFRIMFLIFTNKQIITCLLSNFKSNKRNSPNLRLIQKSTIIRMYVFLDR